MSGAGGAELWVWEVEAECGVWADGELHFYSCCYGLLFIVFGHGLDEPPGPEV